MLRSFTVLKNFLGDLKKLQKIAEKLTKNSCLKGPAKALGFILNLKGIIRNTHHLARPIVGKSCQKNLENSKHKKQA